MVKNLTKEQVESIQLDEGVVVLDYGEDTERVLAPTRGGGEFAVTQTIRDIEFDGKHGKTAGVKAIEEQGASLKVTTIGLTQENLALAIVGVTPEGENKIIKNPNTGVILESEHLKNVTMFTKGIGGKYKKYTIYKALHENGLGVKAQQKAEGELALEFNAHYLYTDLDGDIWSIEELSAAPALKNDSEQN